MKEILLSQLDRENNKLNQCGDLLMTIKVNNYDLHNYMAYLDLVFEFDSIADVLSDIHRAVLECGVNKELLMTCIGFISEISFMVAAFISKVDEFHKALQWNN